MEWCRAIDLAKDIRLMLSPTCLRIEIAGSLRRMRHEINDIELVATPSQKPFDLLNQRIADLLDKEWLVRGPVSKGQKKAPCGPRYYRLQEPNTGIQVDIFAVLPPAEFGVIYTIRTGSAEFSHWIVTEALRKGMKVDGGQLFRIHRDEQPWRFEHIPCPEEQDFFKALEIPWVDPSQREQGLFPALTIVGLAPGARLPTTSTSTAPQSPSSSSSSSSDNNQINQSNQSGDQENG
jgi:DNA polymerase/3'-5' exonuclease PolX